MIPMQGLLKHHYGFVIWLVLAAVMLCGLAWLGWRWWRKRQSLAAAAAAAAAATEIGRAHV